ATVGRLLAHAGRTGRPGRALSRIGEIFPRQLPGGLHINPESRNRVASADFDALSGFLGLPGGFEIAHPAAHIADDVDFLVMFAQTLRVGIYAGTPDEGIAV